MKVTRKKGLLALTSVAAMVAAIAIPTVIAASFATAPSGLAATGPNPSAVVTGTCANTKMTFSSNDATSLSTSSATFSTIPGMSVGFLPAAPCAEITFSGSAQAPANRMMVRALVNGVECLPGEVLFTAFSGDVPGTAFTHSYTFVCRGFALSHHPSTATVEWRAFFGPPGNAFMSKPTMVVRYG